MDDRKESKKRQLAAVMFTDIVGYTALMQGDEEAAMKVRNRHRGVFQQQHEQHHGEIIQYYGDGTLSVFKSAVEAVQCAIEIQRSLQQDDPVPLRIGLHMGDIVFNTTDVYGDGVNYASRIQSMGLAGAVLLSAKINDELKNHPEISTTSLGLFNLKNIEGDVEVFAVTNEGITVPLISELQAKQKHSDKTIAVLPFVNMSANAENEYFSDGITEEIINALSKIKNLKVTSRTSSFYFKNKNIPIRQIGTELNVAAVIEGSVRLAGDKIRITAQLVDTKEDFHFWSKTWDKKLENIFEIQDEISLRIAYKLREHFGHFEIQDHLVGKQTDNIQAYECSLKAKFHFNKWNADDMRKAISLFGQAIDLDPQYTEAYQGLAECYGFMAMMQFMPYAEAWEKSAQLTHKAHALNDKLPAVQYQLARLAFFLDGNYQEALHHTRMALLLNPSYVEAQQFVSYLHILAGQKEKAAQHLQIATKLDPRSQATLFYSAYFDYMVEDYASALEKLDECLRHNPKNIPAHSVKCSCLLMTGRADEVLLYFDTMPEGTVVATEQAGLKGLAYAVKNDSVNALKHLSYLREQAEPSANLIADSYAFLMYAISGEKEKAFAWISHAIAIHSSLLLMRFGDPLVTPIKDDARYLELQQLIFGRKR